MREMIIGQIEMGGFDLKSMIDRINYYHVAGELTDAEREELIQRAQDKAVQDMDVEPKTEILALWEAVHELERRIDEMSGGGDTPEPGEEWPEFVQPTGAHDAYNPGDKVTYHGKHYVCLIANCVWAPDVYPQGWEEQ